MLTRDNETNETKVESSLALAFMIGGLGLALAQTVVTILIFIEVLKTEQQRGTINGPNGANKTSGAK